MKRLSVTLSHRQKVLGWCLLFFELLLFPVVLVTVNSFVARPLDDASLNFLLFAVNFTLTLLIFHRYLGACLRISLSAPVKWILAAFWGLGLYYLSGAAVTLLIQTLTPDFSNLNNESIGAMTRDNYTLMAIGTVIFIPVAEETMYRGLIFGSLHKKSRLAAYLVSSVAFCAIHILGYIDMYEPLHILISFLQYLPAGLCLAFAYEQADSIWAPILMHMTINQLALSALR